MTPLRSIALCTVLLTACTQDAAKAPPGAAEAAAAEGTPAKPPGSVPPNVLPPGDPHATPAPGEDEEEAPLAPSAPGSFDVTLEGKLVHFLRLPLAQNRAVVIPEDGVQRVSIGAVESDAGGPSFRILIEGLRPDQAEYPVTIPAPGDAKGSKDPYTLSVRYEVNDKRVYVINRDKGASVVLTLEGYEGKTLRGRFEGKLAPTMAGLGEPIPVSGTFAVELGLRGVEPGPTPAAASDAPEPAPANASP